MSTARGTVIRRGNTYSVVIDLGRDAEGKRRRQWYSGFATSDAAEVKRTAELGKLDAGTFVKPSELTLSDFIVDSWLPDLAASDLRATTVAMYRRSAEQYLLPHLGQIPMQDLAPVRLKAWLNALKSAGVGARTVQIAYITAHKLLKAALDLELIPRNPAENKEVRKSAPRRKASAPIVWTAEQTRAFLESQQGDRLYPLWRLATTSGLRRGELAGLRWRDVDLEVGELHVRTTRVVVGYTVVENEPKTEESRRAVGLDPATIAALRQHRARQAEEMLGFGVQLTPDSHLFTLQDGTPYHPQRFTAMLAARARSAGLPVVKLHALRHGHATTGLEAGVPMKVMSERLGHSTYAITADIYSHVTAATDRAAAAQIAAAIDG